MGRLYKVCVVALLCMLLQCGKSAGPAAMALEARVWVTGKGTVLTLRERGRLVERDSQGAEIKEWQGASEEVLQVVVLAGKTDVLIRTRSGTRVVDLTGKRSEQNLPVMAKVVGGKWVEPTELWVMFADGKIERWESGARKEQIVPKWPTDNVEVVEAFFGKKSERAVARVVGGVSGYVWNYVLGTLEAELNVTGGHARALSAMDADAEVGVVVTGGEDGRWMRWEIDAQGKVKVPPLGIFTLFRQTASTVQSIAMSADGQFVVTGHNDGSVKTWQSYGYTTSTGSGVVWHEWRSFYGHTGAVMGVGWLDGGTRVMSFSKDETLRVWQHDPDEITNLNRPARSVDWTPAADRLVTHEGGKIYVWDRNSLFQSRGLAPPLALLTSPHLRTYFDARIHPNGKLVAAATTPYGLTPREERKLDLWDISNPIMPRLVVTLRNEPTNGFGTEGVGTTAHSVLGALFTPDGKYLLQQEPSALNCLHLNIWEVDRLLATSRGGSPPVQSNCTYLDWKSISQDGRYLLGSVANYPEISLWELQLPGNMLLKSRVQYTKNVYTLPWAEVFSTDNKRLLVADYYQGLSIWDTTDPATPTLTRSLSGEQLGLAKMSYLSMSSEGTVAIQDYNAFDTTAHLLDASDLRHKVSGVILFPNEGSSSVASSEGRITADGKEIFVHTARYNLYLFHWRVPERKELARLQQANF